MSSPVLPRYGPLSMSSMSLVHLTWWLDTRRCIAAYMSYRTKMRVCRNVFGDLSEHSDDRLCSFAPSLSKGTTGITTHKSDGVYRHEPGRIRSLVCHLCHRWRCATTVFGRPDSPSSFACNSLSLLPTRLLLSFKLIIEVLNAIGLRSLVNFKNEGPGISTIRYNSEHSWSSHRQVQITFEANASLSSNHKTSSQHFPLLRDFFRVYRDNIIYPWT